MSDFLLRAGQYLEKTFGSRKKEQGIEVGVGQQRKLSEFPLRWHDTGKGKKDVETFLQVGDPNQAVRFPIAIHRDEIKKTMPSNMRDAQSQHRDIITLTLTEELKGRFEIMIGGPWAGDTDMGHSELIVPSEEIIKLASEQGLSPDQYTWDKKERRFMKKEEATEPTTPLGENDKPRISNYAEIILESSTENARDRDIVSVGDDHSGSYFWIELHPKRELLHQDFNIMTVGVWTNEGIVRCENVPKSKMAEYRLRNSLTNTIMTGQRVNPGE